MLSYMTIGANDLDMSGRFYDALLLPLGYVRQVDATYIQYALEGVADRDNGPCTVYVMKPFDGGVATPGNGMMPAFRAPQPEHVQALHAAGIAAGGTDEGGPGTRSYYNDTFYVAYLRDPVGNKVAVFAVLEKLDRLRK